jgi:DNA-binding LacI/PurR family transcriptional regulator
MRIKKQEMGKEAFEILFDHKRKIVLETELVERESS